MWLTSISVKRPLLMLLVIGGLLTFGVFAWSRLGVALLPELDYPVVSVVTAYPGAGPEAVDTLVTKQVEDAVAGMNQLDYVQSISSEGVSTVLVVFTDRAAKDSAVDVERRVSAIRGQLPADAKPPSVGKFDPSAQPILTLSMGGNRDLGQLQRLAEDKIQKALESTSGVGRVQILGGLQREIQVQVDQQKLQARGLSILQVNQALAADNLNVPAGSLAQDGRSWTVRLNNQAQTIADLESTPLVPPTGPGPATAPVFLGDVATVVDTNKQIRTLQRRDGRPAVGISVIKASGANTITTVDAVKQELQRLARELPADVRVSVVSDFSVFTKQSVADVQQELAQAVLLTGLVLLVFLHTFRSTLIVLLAIPTSLVATLGVMYVLGLGFNMMSLMGLTLTVGILVDDSIVVLENIFRHLERGEDPREAAINGRSEIGFAAIAITLVDVVVFTPIAFMTGMVGQYFRQFGLVIATATLFSLFISFTLTPLLASRWYSKGHSGEVKQGRRSWNPMARFARVWDAGYQRLERGYARVLRGGLRLRWLVVGVGLVSFVGGIATVALGYVPTEFLPETDEGRLQVTIEMPAGATLQMTDAAARAVEQRIVQSWPEADKVFTTVGTNLGTGGIFAASQVRYARIQVELKDRQHRARTPAQLAAEARTFGTDVPGVVLKARPITLLGGETAAIQVRILGEDQQVLAPLAAQVAAVVRNTPGTADVSDGGVTGQPELVVRVDRARAANLGLTAGQVASVLRTALTGSVVGTFRPEGTRGWDINVILDPRERATVAQITDIPLVTPRGTVVRLGNVARVEAVTGPTQVERRDRQRSVFVTAVLDGRALGDVTREIAAGLSTISVPAGYTVSLGGAAENQADSFRQISAALALSVLLMYVLMVALFESLLYPFIIMLSLPLAVVGAFGLLMITGNTLNMMSLIGLILLTGLVGKNAILLVDYTNRLRKAGLPRNQALLQAGPTRLRPILMTTLALILAMGPLALKLGEGSEWRAPMAVTVIGGLVTSTLLTLVLIPAVYTIMDDFQDLLRRGYGRTRAFVAGRGAASASPAGVPVPLPTVAGGAD